MPPELLNLLIQIPIVAAFMWYSDRKDKQFQDFLREERTLRSTEHKAILDEIAEMHEDMDKAVTTMTERTRPHDK